MVANARHAEATGLAERYSANAASYLKATIKLWQADEESGAQPEHLLAPTLLCLGFSLELAFKAWGLRCGWSEKRLKEFGHQVHCMWMDTALAPLRTHTEAQVSAFGGNASMDEIGTMLKRLQELQGRDGHYVLRYPKDQIVPVYPPDILIKFAKLYCMSTQPPHNRTRDSQTMLTARDYQPHAHATPIGRAVLDYEGRFLRRRVIALEDGRRLLVDLPQTTSLEAGGVLVTAAGEVEIAAAPEPLLEVRGADLPRLAWHVGNRHTPCQIEDERLLIQRDHVLRDMLTRLGATLGEVTEPFTPEGGAYGHGRTHGHDHSHSHGPGTPAHSHG